MTDLQINIALVQAMGWESLSQIGFSSLKKTGFIVDDDEVICGYNFCLLTFKFDCRDPVIFVAICKHWNLRVSHHAETPFVAAFGDVYIADTIEKAAALSVIDAVKRGVK